MSGPGDRARDNLERIHLDFELEAKLVAHLDDRIRSSPDEPFALVLFDVDRSAELRALSIGYKLRILGEMHGFVASILPHDAWLAPLGSRDDLALIHPVARARAKRDALASADLLRGEVSKQELGRELGRPCRLTLSGGIATYPVDAASGLELLLLAEGACRLAKQRGRDRCEAAPCGWSEQLSFAVHPERLDDLEALSLRTGRPVADLLREAIRLVLQRHSGLERFCAGILEDDA